MALVSYHRHAPSRVADGIFAAVAHWFAETRRAWAHRRSVYRTTRALETLSDRTLSDLGLNRGGILSASVDAADRDYGPVDRDRHYR